MIKDGARGASVEGAKDSGAVWTKAVDKQAEETKQKLKEWNELFDWTEKVREDRARELPPWEAL